MNSVHLIGTYVGLLENSFEELARGCRACSCSRIVVVVARIARLYLKVARSR